jgi:hypothetical protein
MSCDPDTDLGLHRPDGPVGEVVDVVLAGSRVAAPLDAEPEEAEPFAHVDNACLRLGQAQAERGPALSRSAHAAPH